MILTEEDLSNFETKYTKLDDDDGDTYFTFLEWLNNNPQILFAADYTDYTSINMLNTVFPKLIKSQTLVPYRPLFRNSNGNWLSPLEFGESISDKWKWIPYKNFYNTEKLFNDEDSLENYGDLANIDLEILEDYLSGHKDSYLHKYLNKIPIPTIKEAVNIRRYYLDRYFSSENIGILSSLILFENDTINVTSFEEIFKRMKLYINNPLLNDRSIISPKIWTPSSVNNQYKNLSDTASSLIHSIQAEKKELDEIKPKQLEDIVAELFRNMGMEVFVNKQHPQGGRDIIGKFKIGNETVSIAIEVKHRKLVDMPLLANFQKQNEKFPLLYLVTSGRFSAGVINESLKNENRMRLKLHDGLALKSLIQTYGIK